MPPTYRKYENDIFRLVELVSSSHFLQSAQHLSVFSLSSDIMFSANITRYLAAIECLFENTKLF